MRPIRFTLNLSRLWNWWIPIICILIGLVAGGAAYGQQNSGSENEQNGGFPEEEFDAFGAFEEFDQSEQRIEFDPLAPYNRLMTTFNDRLYYWVVKPSATGYQTVAPEPVRLSVNRLFRNWGYPIRVVNNILQLKGRAASEETVRFLVNTTVGIGGLFDPAEKLPRLDAHPEDFGQTLGWYGVGEGFPIVLPFLGPSNLRDIVGLVPDAFLYPLDYAVNAYVAVGATVYERINYTSLHLGEYEELTKDALDLYIFMQNAYTQNREKKIKE